MPHHGPCSRCGGAPSALQLFWIACPSQVQAATSPPNAPVNHFTPFSSRPALVVISVRLSGTFWLVNSKHPDSLEELAKWWRYSRFEMVLSPNFGCVRAWAFRRLNGVDVWTASNPVSGVVPGSKHRFLTSKFRPSGLSDGSVCPGTRAPLGVVHHTDILAHERGVLGEIVLAHAMQVLAWSRGTGRTVPLRVAQNAFKSGSLAWSRRPFLPMPSCRRWPAR